MIIDAHCHAGKGDGFTGPWDTDGSLRLYLPRARRAGIDRTVLWGVFHSDYEAVNEQVARIKRAAPERFDAFVFVNADRDRPKLRTMVERFVLQHGFCGMKVHRQDARINRDVCEVARELVLPVVYDVMGETGTVELLAREYPDVDFIIPHLGSFGDDWRAQVALLDQLARFRNVHTDTAGVRRFDNLLDALRRAGPSKLCFGSDGPWLHPGVELAKLDFLPLDAAARRLVLGGNILRLMQRGRHVRAMARAAARSRLVGRGGDSVGSGGVGAKVSVTADDDDDRSSHPSLAAEPLRR